MFKGQRMDRTGDKPAGIKSFKIKMLYENEKTEKKTKSKQGLIERRVDGETDS